LSYYQVCDFSQNKKWQHVFGTHATTTTPGGRNWQQIYSNYFAFYVRILLAAAKVIQMFIVLHLGQKSRYLLFKPITSDAFRQADSTLPIDIKRI
jgi:hypothetical protein